MKKTLFLATLPICSLFAAAPVATVTAGPDVKINGKPIPTDGVPNWPLAPGDTILTADSAAVILFANGLRLTAAPHSELAVPKKLTCSANVLRGGVTYSRPASASLSLCVSGRPQTLTATQGTLSTTTLAAPVRTTASATPMDNDGGKPPKKSKPDK